MEELLNKLQSRVRSAIERIDELKRSNDDLLRLNRSLAEDNQLLNAELEDKAVELAGVEELKDQLAETEERQREAVDKLNQIISELDAVLEQPFQPAASAGRVRVEPEEYAEDYDEHPRVVPPTEQPDGPFPEYEDESADDFAELPTAMDAPLDEEEAETVEETAADAETSTDEETGPVEGLSLIHI